MKTSFGRKPFDLSLAKAGYFDLSGQTPFVAICGNPGTAYKFDMHYGLEFGIVMSGRKTFIFPDLTIHLSAGNVWFCGMWEPHGWATVAQSYEEVNIIIWPPALTALQFEDAPTFDWLAPFSVSPAQRPQTGAEILPAMLEIGAKIKNCLEIGGEQNNLWLRLYVMEAILLAARKSPGTRARTKMPSDGAESLNQLLKHFFKERGLITTANAARMCGINRNKFSLMFRRLMGLPFADFALRYRLNSAASSLRRTTDPIKNIALSWGFADTSHFDRLFARFYGCTPHKYRQKNANS